MLTSLKNLYNILNSRGKIKIWLLLFAMILASLLEAVGVGSIPLFLSFILNPEKLDQYPAAAEFINKWGLHEQQKMLIVGSTLLLTFFILKNTYISVVEYYRSNFVFNTQHNLRTRLFQSYLQAPFTFHLDRNISELLNKTNAEIRRLITGVLIPSLKMVLNTFITLSIFILLIVADPVITLISFLLLSAISYLFFKIIRKKTHEYGHQEKKYRVLMVKQMIEALSSLKSAIVHGKRPYFYNSFSDSSHKTSVAGRYNEFAKGVTKPFIETMAVLSIITIILMLFWQEKSMESIASLLTLFGVSFLKIMPSFRQAINDFADIKYNYMLIDPIYNDLKLLEPHTKKSKSKNTTEINFQKSIELRNVTFKYPDASANALEDINLQISKGSSVAFVGATGAGKSTLVDLLLGLLHPTSGQIAVDDIDIHSNLPSWLKHVGYVPQEIFLMDDTIANNVAFGIAEDQIDQEKLRTAINSAQLELMVEQLPDGIQTKVGDRGMRLSGGQRQRIGIARALYHQPQVLIMDEATSALDNTTEKVLMQSIENLRKNYTLITIAHRLSTIRNCDKIYFIKKGMIVSSGTYDELLTLDTDFQQMTVR